MNYIEYLNKRETVIHPQECVAQFVQESEDSEGDGQEEKEMKEGKDYSERMGDGDGGKLQGENSISNQINQQDLEQMIDLENQSREHSDSQHE